MKPSQYKQMCKRLNMAVVVAAAVVGLLVGEMIVPPLLHALEWHYVIERECHVYLDPEYCD